MLREIRIVGGGLAGLTLGLLLRREGVPTQIFDAGTYPRPKVCGEFISGKGAVIAKQLDLVSPEFTTTASTVRFFDRERSSGVMPLPQEALSIDRAALDESLARSFQKLGGVLRENVRWSASFEGEGLVRATGRRLGNGNAGTMLGIKVHARNIPLHADLELHFSDSGYIGLSRQPGGMVNVCALFVSKTAFNREAVAERDFVELFSPEMGPLRERLQCATFEISTFAAVAGVSLRREKAVATRECRIGDTICMIPPMTGNGMSIALESAALAAPILRDYSRGRIEWKQAQKQISRDCDQAFSRRLRCAGLLQMACFRKSGRRLLLMGIQAIPCSLKGPFWLTR